MFTLYSLSYHHLFNDLNPRMPAFEEKQTKLWMKTRYRLAGLVFIGNIILMSLRFSISVAMIDMVKPMGLVTHGECGNGSVKDDNVTSSTMFEWDTKQQGLVLGAFFYGYCVTQILGGYMADK